MKTINKYIIEKLHLTKDISIDKDEIIRFIVIYSDKGKTNYQVFKRYKNAIDYAKNDVFFLDGYCLTCDEYNEMFDSVIYDSNIKQYSNWDERVLNFAKKRNLIKLFDYEEDK